MKTKYPIVLVHGIMLKDILCIKAFGKIEKVLSEAGEAVYTSNHDGLGTIEDNASQLKRFINEILEKENTDKVNVIAHSKGGLDTLYMINSLNMGEHVASVTFLCTPHKGSVIADKIFALPRIVKGTLAFWLNFWYQIFGDENPNALKVCEQLCTKPEGISAIDSGANTGIFMQSFSANMEKPGDDFIMGIPHMIHRYCSGSVTDGMVSADSSMFGLYRGHATDFSISHSQIVDFMAKKSHKEKIYGFYLEICRELSEMGY